MITVENFRDYLILTFGKKIDKIIAVRNNDIELILENIGETPHETDKCTKCKASKYRQDIPFWKGTINKDIMLISQDAGKGIEDNQINCVFSLQVAALNEELYKNDKQNPNHKKYYELYSKISHDFINSIYFTDIVKCAYSSDKSVKLIECICCDNIFAEINIVNPKIIILMGTPAKNSFIEIAFNHGRQLQLKQSFSEIINSKGKISFNEYLLDNAITLFCIPHFIGDLRISSEYQDKFKDFKERCLSIVSKRILNENLPSA